MCHCHPFTFTAVKHSAGCLHHSSLIPSALGGHWTISGLSYYRQCCKRHSRSCPFGIRGCSSCSCRFLGMELLLDRVCLTSFFFFTISKCFSKRCHHSTLALVFSYPCEHLVDIQWYLTEVLNCFPFS